MVPLIALAATGLVGAGVGFVAGDGLDGVSRLAKWGALGFGLYLVWDYMQEPEPKTVRVRTKRKKRKGK